LAEREILVRAATEADLPAVLRLYAQPEIDGEDAILPIDEARAIFARFATYPDYVLYVAAVEGRVVGSFALLVMDNLGHYGAPSAIAEDVVVAPEEQGRGIGSAMMRRAVELARGKGCYKLALSSNLKRERAHAFYDGLGFERHGYSFRVAFEGAAP
jgi:GNAT superfamily N-acetyltransferase